MSIGKRLRDIEVTQHIEELKECQKIFRELMRTVETNGCYCPFNKTYPCQAKVVHEVREILRTKIEGSV